MLCYHIHYVLALLYPQNPSASGTFFTRAAEGHRLLADHLSGVLSTQTASGLPVYGIKYLLAHLIHSQASEDKIRSCITDLGLIRKVFAQGHHYSFFADMAALQPRTAVVADVLRWLSFNMGLIAAEPTGVYQAAMDAPSHSIMSKVVRGTNGVDNAAATATANSSAPGATASLPVDFKLINKMGTWSGATMSLQGHTSAVTAATFSPSGHLLASADAGGAIRLWDSVSGESKAVMSGHGVAVAALVFSPCGRVMVSAAAEREMRVWDPSSGEMIAAVAGHSAGVNALAFSSDGTWLASGSSDNTVILWQVFIHNEAPTGTSAAAPHSIRCTFTQETRLEGHIDSVTSVAFGGTAAAARASTDDQQGACLWLASGSADRNIRLWDVKSHQHLAVLQGHGHTVSSVVFDASGLELLSGSFDSTMRVWSLAGLQQREDGTWGDGPGGSGGAQILRPVFDTTLNSFGVGSIAAYIPSTPVAAGGMGGAGQWMVALGHDTHAQLGMWHAASSASSAPRVDLGEVMYGHTGTVNCVCFSPDGGLVCSASSDKTLKLWVPQGASAGGSSSVSPMEAGLLHHRQRCAQVDYNHQRGRLLSFGVGWRVVVWDPRAGGRVVAASGQHPDILGSACYSPDGRQMATGCWDAGVRVFAAGGGPAGDDYDGGGAAGGESDEGGGAGMGQVYEGELDHHFTLRDHNQGHIINLVYSSDSTLLASASNSPRDTAIRVWQAQEGALVHRLAGHSDAVTQLRFCCTTAGAGQHTSEAAAGSVRHSTLLASGSRDKTVRLWDTASGTCLSVLQGHSGMITSLTFAAGTTNSPNDTSTAQDVNSSTSGVGPNVLLASGCAGGEIRVWEVGSGDVPLSCLQLPGQTAVSEVRLSTCGRLLAAAGDGDVVGVWALGISTAGDGSSEGPGRPAALLTVLQGYRLLAGDHFGVWSVGSECVVDVVMFKVWAEVLPLITEAIMAGAQSTAQSSTTSLDSDGSAVEYKHTERQDQSKMSAASVPALLRTSAQVLGRARKLHTPLAMASAADQSATGSSSRLGVAMYGGKHLVVWDGKLLLLYKVVQQ